MLNILNKRTLLIYDYIASRINIKIHLKWVVFQTNTDFDYIWLCQLKITSIHYPGIWYIIQKMCFK